MNSWIGVILACALLASVLALVVLDRYRDKLERRFVKVGDLWEHIGVETHPRRRTRGFYAVVRVNGNTEAGPDSWVMRTLDGRTLYMHHGERVKPDSDWILAMRDGRPMRREKDVRRSIARQSLITMSTVLASP